jgi:hypothetical protein
VFSSRADAFLGSLPTFVSEANALADEVNGHHTATETLRNETQALRNETQALRDSAATHAANAATSASDAAASAASAATSAANVSIVGTRYLGAKASDPTTDNSGNPLEAGALYWNTTSNHMRVWSGSAWQQAAGSLTTPIASTDITDSTAIGRALLTAADAAAARALVGVPFYTYEDRGTLRSTIPSDGELALVDGLGLFIFRTGSDEPDDDESCFATATGRWLLEAAHWDVVDTWQLPDDEARDAWDEDEPMRFANSFANSFASSFASKVLFGTATCAISSVAATSSVSFTGTVTGAAVGNRVIATPPAQLGSDAANTSRLAYHAWVSAPNTVTIMLTNASAAAATVNSAVQTAWPITVIKEV